MPIIIVRRKALRLQNAFGRRAPSLHRKFPDTGNLQPDIRAKNWDVCFFLRQFKSSIAQRYRYASSISERRLVMFFICLSNPYQELTA